MKKIVIGIIAGFFAMFFFLTAGLLEMVSTTPMQDLPPEIQTLLGYYQPAPGTNVTDGITWMAPINYTGTLAQSDKFGWRVHPIYGDLRLHEGVDLGAPEGTPIYATRDGTVSYAGYNDSAGNHVVIQHDEIFSSVYMHMVYFIVSSGEQVQQGQIIGFVGSTGDSTGPHLHFVIRYHGQVVDPELYVDVMADPTEPPSTTAATQSVGQTEETAKEEP